MKNRGILDPEGKYDNPVTNKPYSDEYRNLAKVWSKFPAYQNAKQIIKDISDNQVILLTSGTGSGKTVLMPKYVWHSFDYKGLVGITLPKQILAESSAQFSARTLDVQLGVNIGFNFKGSDKKYSNIESGLMYATDGTIVAQLLKDPELKAYNAVVIDEAHERKVQIDFLLYLLRNTCKLRKDFKLIIMSATVNQTIFANYFEGMKYHHIDVGGATNYPIESIYAEKSIDKNQYVAKGLEIVQKILSTTDDGDILFFVPSINEAFDVCKKLSANYTTVSEQCYCVEVFADMNPEKQEYAIDKLIYKTKFGKSRKLAVSTNVAESSLTIDGIKFVIDSGYENFSSYDPEIDCNLIEKKFITKAQVKQRMGRTGRTSAGTCYHLYTQKEYEAMQDFPQPSIRTSNIYGECLRLLALDSIQSVDVLTDCLQNFIEPPNLKYIKQAINKLTNLGLIQYDSINKLGKIVADMQLEPAQGVAVLTGYEFNCSKEVIAIIALLDAMQDNIGKLFSIPTPDSDSKSNMTQKFEKAKKELSHKYGDHLSLLKIYSHYLNIKADMNKLNQWTFKHFLRQETLKKTTQYFRKIKEKLRTIIPTYTKKNNVPDIMTYKLDDRVIAALLCGYLSNVAHLRYNNKYDTSNLNSVRISRNSWLADTHSEKKELLYHELLKMSNGAELVICSIIPKESKKIFELFIK